MSILMCFFVPPKRTELELIIQLLDVYQDNYTTRIDETLFEEFIEEF